MVGVVEALLVVVGVVEALLVVVGVVEALLVVVGVVKRCGWCLVCNDGAVQVDPSGELLLLAQGGCPWKEHLFALEKELKVDVPIKFVLYSDQNGHWRVQCVPAGLNTFQNRCVFS